MNILHQLHEQPVPGGLPLLQSIDSNSAIEAAWVLDLQAVGKHPHLDMAATHELAVVPVSYGIDNGLSQGDLRVLRNVLPGDASNEAAFTHAGHYIVRGIAEHQQPGKCRMQHAIDLSRDLELL
jgi:hypothetical protein